MDQENSVQIAIDNDQKKKIQRPRMSVADKEQAIRDKIAEMHVRLEKLEQQKIDQQAKKLDKIWKRLRVHMLALGLADVSASALEQLLSDNAEKLRQQADQ